MLNYVMDLTFDPWPKDQATCCKLNMHAAVMLQYNKRKYTKLATAPVYVPVFGTMIILDI